MYRAQIILDSIAPHGVRLTTFEVSYPRMVHAELMTHRLFSRNSSSSRAIPQSRLRKQIIDDPAMPVWWGENQRGMQANQEVDEFTKAVAINEWIAARDQMLAASDKLTAMGLHKQIANRLLEPWMFITVIVSATDYRGWFFQRAHPDAQPEIQRLAYMMKHRYTESTPQPLGYEQYHMPYVTEEEHRQFHKQELVRLSVARCARVSYLTHDGEYSPESDFNLYERLLKEDAPTEPQHMSPFEHVARPASHSKVRSGNFTGWLQYRKHVERPIPDVGEAERHPHSNIYDPVRDSYGED